MKKTAVDFLANALDINTKSLIFEQAKEIEKQQKDKFAIGFGVWLSMNCQQSNSKDAWWIFKCNWITTDELLEIYKKEQGI